MLFGVLLFSTYISKALSVLILIDILKQREWPLRTKFLCSLFISRLSLHFWLHSFHHMPLSIDFHFSCIEKLWNFLYIDCIEEKINFRSTLKVCLLTLFQILKLMTQLIFTTWGLFLFGTFLYAGKRVLGVMTGSSSSSNEGSSMTSHNEKGNNPE